MTGRRQGAIHNQTAMSTQRLFANDSPLPTTPLRRSSASRVDALLSEIQACRVCEAHLPLGPRPIVRISPSARILMVGQAPGLKVHESGIPWNDASGKRLREWLGVEESVFYDPRRFAIVPMSLCYPGRGLDRDSTGSSARSRTVAGHRTPIPRPPATPAAVFRWRRSTGSRFHEP